MPRFIGLDLPRLEPEAGVEVGVEAELFGEAVEAEAEAWVGVED